MDAAPENIELVYWDYYHDRETPYDAMLSMHSQFAAKTVFAGGVWGWYGPAPDFQKTLLSTVPSLAMCKKHGIKEVFATYWGDNGGECSILGAIAGLQLFAELDYTGEYNPENFDKALLFNTGIPSAASNDQIGRAHV